MAEDVLRQYCLLNLHICWSLLITHFGAIAGKKRTVAISFAGDQSTRQPSMLMVHQSWEMGQIRTPLT
eukprot:1889837-Amphidinium_carterae.1